MADDPTELDISRTSEPKYFYSNYAAITAAPEEFIFRFCIRDPDEPARIKELARVFITLGHAKRLVSAMARSLKLYEENFGEIVADPISHATPALKRKLGITDEESESK